MRQFGHAPRAVPETRTAGAGPARVAENRRQSRAGGSTPVAASRRACRPAARARAAQRRRYARRTDQPPRGTRPARAPAVSRSGTAEEGWSTMLVVGFPALAFGTNCFVLAPAAGEECVVVDPGIGVADQLDAVVREHRLQPVAVLLTHGHLDHTFSVAPVCRAAGSARTCIRPTRRCSPTRRSASRAETAAMLAASGLDLRRARRRRPARRHRHDHARRAHVHRRPRAGPHARARCCSGLPTCPRGEDDRTGTVLSGDVLFAGSIGRTDLPGGDPAR